MTRFCVFDSSNASDVREWLNLWNAWPDREVFAHPSYVQLYAAGRTRALCAAWASGGVNVLYPFLMRDLRDEPFYESSAPAFDITSAYGYAGPFAWGKGDWEDAARDFWGKFRHWAVEANAVSEFVRFSLFSSAILPYPGEQWTVSKHVVRSLNPEESVLWMDFEHKVRKNVNKALRSGVHIKIDDQGYFLDDFLRIYNSTMERRDALGFYYFPRDYFERLQTSLTGHFVYFHAMLEGRIISTELILVSDLSVYSFLGGTAAETFACRPNDLLKFEIMKWAKQHGKSSFVLGGGYALDDGIYRYKLAFAPSGQMPYRQGGQVFRDETYHDLISQKQRFESRHGHDWVPRAGFFPAYRS